MTEIFIITCQSGRLDIARHIHKTTSINVHDKRDVAFINSCGYGHMNVAEWLYPMVKNHKNYKAINKAFKVVLMVIWIWHNGYIQLNIRTLISLKEVVMKYFLRVV